MENSQRNFRTKSEKEAEKAGSKLAKPIYVATIIGLNDIIGDINNVIGSVGIRDTNYATMTLLMIFV